MLLLMICTFTPKTEAGDSFHPQIVTDASGNAMAIWVSTDMTGLDSIYAARKLSTDSVWQPPIQLSMNLDDSYDPRLEVDASSGNIVALWGFENASTGTIGLKATMFNGINWSLPPTTVSDPIERVNLTRNNPGYRLKINAQGNVVAIWSSISSGQQVIRFAAAPFGGPWTTPVTVSQ